MTPTQNTGLPALILASTSRYRAELLTRLSLPFTCMAPDIDETPLPGETPAATAMRLAIAKADVVAQKHPDALVIGSDQVAVCQGRQLGKPGTYDRALAQLQAMRGQDLVFHTAVCLADGRTRQRRTADVPTTVRMRDLPDTALETYLRLEQPYDVAGSAKVEGLGIALLEHVRSDDPTALIGLPLITVSQWLADAGLSALSALAATAATATTTAAARPTEAAMRTVYAAPYSQDTP